MAILNTRKIIYNVVKNTWLTLVLFPVISLFIAGNTLGADVFSRDQVLRTAFPLAETFVRQVVRLSDDQVKKLSKESGQKISSRFVTVYIAKKDDGTLGHGFVGYTKGKSSSIKYFVAITEAGKIRSIEIMSYKGEKGSEVRREVFKRQFAGMEADRKIRFDSEINAISGATISSQAITKGVQKTVYIWLELFGPKNDKFHKQ